MLSVVGVHENITRIVVVHIFYTLNSYVLSLRRYRYLCNPGDFTNASVERNAWKDARSSFALVLVDNANA